CEGTTRRERRTQDNKEGRKREQLIRFCLEVSDAVADRGIHHGLAAEGIGKTLPAPFEEQLIDAIIFVEQTERSFKTLRQSVKRRRTQALLVLSLEFQHETSLACFRKEDFRPDESEQIHHFI